MKYKKKLANLKARQTAFDRMNASDQHANTRPGSEKEISYERYYNMKVTKSVHVNKKVNLEDLRKAFEDIVYCPMDLNEPNFLEED